MFRTSTSKSLPELTAILLARLGFLWLLVLLSLVLPGGDIAFYAFMGIAFIITIPYSLWVRSRVRTAQFAPLQFLVDLILVTGLVYFTGGTNSELTLLYPLVILSAGIVGTPKQAMQITVLAITVYGLMAVLLSNHWIVEYVPADLYTTSDSARLSPILNGLSFLLFGGASIYISKQCNHMNSHRRELSQTTKALLTGIPAPALLLDHEGDILFANDAFCRMVGSDFEQLGALPFSQLQALDLEAIPEHYGPAVYLRRTGLEPLPAAYQANDIDVLETALLGSNGRQNETLRVTLLTFTDIFRALELEKLLKKVEHVTAAAQMAGEMAHEIQAPLTAISASVELLRGYEERTTAADWLPNSPHRNDRKELFNHIEDASSRMNRVITNFVSFTAFSPQDLLSIIKLDSTEQNEGYIGHLNTLGRGYTNGQNSDCG